jgi:hexosaminidase
MWNDGIHGAAEAAKVPASTMVEHWLGSGGIATPQQLADTGHDVLNVSYDTYMIRPFGDTTSKAAGLYARRWDPTQFHGGHVLTGPHLLGARVTVWQDTITADTERDVEANMSPMVRFMAQVTWGAPNPDADYATFAARAAAVGRTPGYVNEDLPPVEPGRYTISTTEGTLGAGAAPSGVPVGKEAADWTLAVNARGYYRLQSGGRCLSLTANAAAVTTIGFPLILETCSGSPGQQFRLTAVNQGGGYTISPASSQMLLTTGNGVAVQRPGDQVRADAIWRLTAVNG